MLAWCMKMETIRPVVNDRSKPGQWWPASAQPASILHYNVSWNFQENNPANSLMVFWGLFSVFQHWLIVRLSKQNSNFWGVSRSGEQRLTLLGCSFRWRRWKTNRLQVKSVNTMSLCVSLPRGRVAPWVNKPPPWWMRSERGDQLTPAPHRGCTTIYNTRGEDHNQRSKSRQISL